MQLQLLRGHACKGQIVYHIHQRNIQSLAIELFKVKRNLSNVISISYRTVPSTIWSIFSEFLIFCRLITEIKAKYEKRGKYFPYCTSKRAITSLSLT